MHSLSLNKREGLETINTEKLPAGFYFLKIEENGKTMFQDKFIVARY